MSDESFGLPEDVPGANGVAIGFRAEFLASIKDFSFFFLILLLLVRIVLNPEDSKSSSLERIWIFRFLLGFLVEDLEPGADWLRSPDLDLDLYEASETSPSLWVWDPESWLAGFFDFFDGSIFGVSHENRRGIGTDNDTDLITDTKGARLRHLTV